MTKLFIDILDIKNNEFKSIRKHKSYIPHFYNARPET